MVVDTDELFAGNGNVCVIVAVVGCVFALVTLIEVVFGLNNSAAGGSGCLFSHFLLAFQRPFNLSSYAIFG